MGPGSLFPHRTTRMGDGEVTVTTVTNRLRPDQSRVYSASVQRGSYIPRISRIIAPHLAVWQPKAGALDDSGGPRCVSGILIPLSMHGQFVTHILGLVFHIE